MCYCEKVSNMIDALFMNLIHPEKKKDTTHFMYYASSAAANSLSMVGANMSLRWVSYPAQVIIKSAKPLSVMLLGLMFCKRYTIQRYFFVLVIVTGVVVFKLFEAKEEKPVKTKTENHEISDMYQMFGTCLLIFSLTMDGVLGAIQDRMRSIHAPTFRQLMFNTYLWGCGYLIIVILVTKEFLGVFPFIGRHPEVLWHFLTFGMADAIGNVFIFTMISCFGALACSVTGTVRKFFSVIFSIIFFGHPSTLLQWFGACLVFAALLADAFFGKNKKKSVKELENEDIEKGESSGSDGSKVECVENIGKGENVTEKGADIQTVSVHSVQKGDENRY
ncbi:solute carrier family 35 member B1-like isoform X2 [Contarinia nasturtii]|uniref:solute carrier family 35 member B1-like isoform X2 n=1 Tax=Contarinia nasturtii TaxID=265458 RepID=UPI0012D3F5B7|nr:solute carrier family 35 member B1-like isoform X2 [Contarinia nasturtii]